MNKLLWIVYCQILIGTLLFCLHLKTLEVYPTINPSKNIHKTLYLDRHINIVRALQIQMAAQRWSDATNHLVQFDIVQLPITNSKEILDSPDNIIVIEVSEDDPNIINIDGRDGTLTVAYYNGRLKIPTLGIVQDRITDDMYEKIILHELGHVLDLEHVDEPNQVMYPTTDLMGELITREDLRQFCKLHHCDANKLKDEEEFPHF